MPDNIEASRRIETKMPDKKEAFPNMPRTKEGADKATNMVLKASSKKLEGTKGNMNFIKEISGYQGSDAPLNILGFIQESVSSGVSESH